MGAFADLIERPQGRPVLFKSARDQAVWQNLFRTDKESGGRRYDTDLPAGHVTGTSNDRGSYVRSAVAGDAAQVRLLQALRSRAPGGWTDDRYAQSRAFIGVAYICIHRAGVQLQQAEFQVFEKDPNHQDGKRPVEPDHPLVELLEKPNNEDSFGDLMYIFWQQQNLTGTSLAWMVPSMLPSQLRGRDGEHLGTPMELYPLQTAIAIPQPTINPDYPEGFYRIQPLYPYGPFSSYPTPSTAVGAPIGGQWILRNKFHHPLLRYDGWSPLTALSLHIDEVTAMDRSRFYSMLTGVNPSAILNPRDVEGLQPFNQDEIDRIHAEWEANFQGVTNAGKLIVGSPGFELEPWGNRPIDMDYPNGWDQLTAFCMSGFGMSKAAAFMSESSSYANLFASLKQLHLMTLQPFCDQIASKITRRLAPFFGKKLIVEIRCRRIDDHDVTMSLLEKAMTGKAIKKNELRRIISNLDSAIELPPIEEYEDENAGFEAPPEQPGMPGIPGAEGMPGAAPPGQEEEELILPELPDEGEGPLEAPEVVASQEGPGNLGVGALGPRKSLWRERLKRSKSSNVLASIVGAVESKSLFEAVQEALNHENGNHWH